MPKIKLDDRPIRAIGWAPDDEMPLAFNSVTVGDEGVTSIDAWEMTLGDYSIVWLQIWCNDKLMARYNARNIDSILYFQDD